MATDVGRLGSFGVGGLVERYGCLELVTGCLMAWATIHLTAYAVLRQRLKASSAARTPFQTAHAVTCLVHNAVVSIGALRIVPWRALVEEDVWNTYVPGTDPLSLLMGTFFLYDVCMCWCWDSISYALLVHHLGGVGACIGTLYTGFAQSWVCYAMATELSSIFLSMRSIATDLYGKQSTLYRISSLLFILAFLAVRSVPSPFLAVAWLKNPPLSEAVCGPNLINKAFGWVSGVPMALNPIWTVQILRKAAREIRSRPKARTD